MVITARPTPLRDVAQDVSITVGLVGGAVTALVGYGVLSVAQGSAMTSLLGLIPGVIASVTAVVAAHRTARTGEAHVTPLSSPMTSAGERLVPSTWAAPQRDSD